MFKKVLVIEILVLTVCCALCNGQSSSPQVRIAAKPSDLYLNLRGSVKSISERTYSVPFSEFSGYDYKNAIVDGNMLKNVHTKWYFEETHLGNEDLPAQSTFFRLFYPNKDIVLNKDGCIVHLSLPHTNIFYTISTDTMSAGYCFDEQRIYENYYIKPIYDSVGNLIDTEETPFDRVVYQLRYRYNAQNQLVAQTLENGKIVSTFDYNDKGQLNVENFSNGAAVLIYRYNNNGLISYVTVVEGEDIYHFSYIYNENRDISHLTSRKRDLDNSYSTGEQRAEYEYEYDSFGNWTKRYETVYNQGYYKKKGITRYVTVRNIEYYP